MLNIAEDWTIFLDRDGVINKRNFIGYIERIEDFIFLDGAVEAIAALNTFFQYTFVVTNQQGVGKGIMTERNLSDLHGYMLEELKKSSAKITKIYYSPDLKNNPNNTRKPKPSMALKAQSEFEGIDFKKSVMVGDTNGDIAFGKNLGMTTVLIRSKEVVTEKADYEFYSLLEFSKNIKKHA